MKHTPHRPVTIKEVAKQANVSIATVSRVLNSNGAVTEETRNSVIRVMNDLGYNRNEVARSLKMRYTKTIGIIAPKLSNVYFMEVVETMDSLLTPLGYTMIISCSNDSVEEEQHRIQVLLDRNVDALVVIPAGFQGHHFTDRVVSRVPIVMVDRYIEGVKADAVLVDNRSGVREMVKALYDEGFRRIGYVGGDLDILTANERYAGYLQTLQELGLEAEPEFTYLEGKMAIKDGRIAMERFFMKPDPPKAFLVANDLLHLGVTSHLIEHLPEDQMGEYVLASFDYLSYSPLLSFCHYAMRQPQELIGTEVVRLLLKRMRSKERGNYEKVIIEPELKVLKNHPH